MLRAWRYLALVCAIGLMACSQGMGTLVPDGSRDGSSFDGATMDGALPDSGTNNGIPDGATVLEDGAVVLPDGAFWYPDTGGNPGMDSGPGIDGGGVRFP